ncbi:MAG TPA: Ig-like domain-containing protein, partial [Candidatus Entotheonella sp.]
MTFVRSATLSMILLSLVVFLLLMAGCGQTPDTITIDPDTTTLAVGQTQQFRAMVRDKKGRDIEDKDLKITWSVEGEGGRINADGNFTAVKAGSATVIAATAEIRGTAAVTVTPEPVAKLETDISPKTVVAGEAATLTVTARNTAGNGVADAPIQVTAKSDGTRVEPATATTNDSGQAVFTITTAAKVQANQVTIQSGAQQTATVVQTQAGAPASVRLMTDAADMVAGSEKTVQVLVLDQAENPVPNVTVHLHTGNSGATVTPAQVTTDDQGRATAILKASSSVGANELSASVEGVETSPSMAFQSMPGAPVQLTLQADSPSMIAGGRVNLMVTVQDGNGNPVPEADVNLAVSASDATLEAATLTTDARGTAATVLQLSSSPGEVTVDATVADTAASVSIIGQPPVELQVSPKTVTLEMWETQAFQATAADADGHAIRVAPQWEVGGENGVIDTAGRFAAQGLGNEAVIATHAGLTDGAQITIVPGEAAAVDVVPAEISVTAGTNFQFQAKVLNAHGYPLGTAPTWTVSNDIGSIDAVGLFTAIKTGAGDIIATIGEQSGRAQVTVTPGPLTRVEVEPKEVRLKAGEEVQFQAMGYDAGGNEIEVEATWNLNAELGDLSADGTFRALHSGTGEIQVEAGPAPAVMTIPVEVVAAELDRVAIEPTALTVSAGEQHLFTATGYDAFDNVVEIAPEWRLSTDGVGQINEAGSFYARKTGSVQVLASAGEFQAKADVTVKPSQLARLVIQPEGPLTLKAGTSVSFILNGYDAFENAVAPNPTWSQTTPLGTISAEGTFRAETVGDGTLMVQQDDIRVVVPVSVTPGNLARIDITPTEATLQAGNILKFQAKGFDAYDNEVSIEPVWRVTESIGEIHEAGEFRALRVQQGEVIATAGGVSGSVQVAVEPGPVTMLYVTPEQLALKGGETAEIIVMGYDAYGNPAPVTPTWRIPDDMGEVNGSIFTAQKAGSGRLVIVAESLAEVVELTVEPGSLASLAIEPNNAKIRSGEAQDFTVQGYDLGGNPVPADITWEVQGETASMTPEGVFTATRAGTMQVLAKFGDIVGQTDVEVLPGPAMQLELKAEVSSLAAGETLRVTSTAVDAAGNVIAAVPEWTVEGGIGTMSEDGVFTAQKAGTGTIIGTLDDATHKIDIEVVPGDLVSIGITPQDPVIKAGEKQQFEATGSDAYGNSIPVEVRWSLHGNIGRIDAATGLFEADKAGAGAVIAVSGTIAGINSITVEPNKLAQLQLDPRHTVAAGEGVELRLAAFDAYHNQLAPELQWEMSEPLGKVIGGVFWGEKIGTTVVTARSGGLEAQTTVQVQLGPVIRLQIMSEMANVQVGDRVPLRAIGFDTEGNSSDVAVTWELSGAIGSLNDSGEFSPTKPGGGQITARLDDLSVSAAVMVTSGQVQRLELSPAQAQVASTTTQSFAVKAFDAMGNEVVTPVKWALSTPIGAISQTGTFTGMKRGDGLLVAYADGAVATAAVSVQPGPVAQVFITPQPLQA